MSNRQVAKANRKTLEAYFQKGRQSLTQIAVSDKDVDRVVRFILNETIRTPRLAECPPQSIVLAAAEWLDSRIPVRRGYGCIVPRSLKGKMTAIYQPMYQGLLELAYASERVDRVSVRAVFEGEKFHLEFGSADRIIHHPTFPPPPTDKQWDELAACYSCVWLHGHDLPVFSSPMSRRELESFRNQVAPTNRAGKIVGPWADDPISMSLKTVLKRTLKLVPLSPDLARAVSADDASDHGYRAVDVPALRLDEAYNDSNGESWAVTDSEPIHDDEPEPEPEREPAPQGNGKGGLV